MFLNDSNRRRWAYLRPFLHPLEVYLVAVLAGRCLMVLFGTFNPYMFGVLYDHISSGEDTVTAVIGLVTVLVYLVFWGMALRFHIRYLLRLAGSVLLFSEYAAFLFFFVQTAGVSPPVWTAILNVIACVYVFLLVADKQRDATYVEAKEVQEEAALDENQSDDGGPDELH